MHDAIKLFKLRKYAYWLIFSGIVIVGNSNSTFNFCIIENFPCVILIM